VARARGIWNSTPLRQSLAMAVLFALASFASLAVTYVIVRDNAQASLRATLEQQMAGFAALPDTEDIVDFVRAQSRTASAEDRILSYVRPDGQIAGNAALVAPANGPTLMSIDRGNDHIDGDYLVLSRPLRGGQMTIALSAGPLQDIREAFLSVFLFSLVPTVLIVVGGGVLLAWRAVDRLTRIDTALDRLTSGDYAARVAPMPGRADDLSLIGARIDTMAQAQERHISALRQVSADIAHDLKTPIQRVSVLLTRLRDRPGLAPESAALADQANAETDGIVRTFQALLQIAQIEGGSPKARFEPVDIADLARTFCEVYEPSAEESGHALTCAIPDTPVRVRGDKTLLGQVLANLMENALRHTPPGAVISVNLARRDGAVRLSVGDSGPGIPVAERENVLRRLYRLERSRTTPGNGLGLSLVAAIIEMHDGALQLLDNDPGLRVEITLPDITLPDITQAGGTAPGFGAG
tara:strand:+ start:1309 stop:2712 length:1404 start_codon:yes stop_codon:yes gene_type:complete